MKAEAIIVKFKLYPEYNQYYIVGVYKDAYVSIKCAFINILWGKKRMLV